MKIAYLANLFPAAVEHYVVEEIQELQNRGVHVVAGSVRKPRTDHQQPLGWQHEAEVLCLQPVRVQTLLRAFVLLLLRRKRVASLVKRILRQGNESPKRRAKALLHTILGACYAVQLQDHRVDHIHVHHGYFGSWIAMVAARFLGVGFSLTLHGSDLLLHGAYLDTKLMHCQFCATISDYNRRYILQHYPGIDPEKILVSRLGTDVPARTEVPHTQNAGARLPLTLLAVGRLQAVKDHAFLIRACARLHDCGLDFECAIAGEGPERRNLESLIRQNHLDNRVRLLGHATTQEMDSLYRQADIVVLTSRSEGIPLVLMEAMARGKIVLAPAITGIPELVIAGKTGFLYAPGEIKDFTAKILSIEKQMHQEDRNAVSRLDWVRHAARAQVLHNFNRSKNLTRFADRFLQLVATGQPASQNWRSSHEDFVLQQI